MGNLIHLAEGAEDTGQQADINESERVAWIPLSSIKNMIARGEHPTVSVRVMSREVGVYPAMGSPFTLLGFPHRQRNDVAYLETFIESEYTEDPALTEQCAQRFARLQQLALDPCESLELIAEAASLADPPNQPAVSAR